MNDNQFIYGYLLAFIIWVGSSNAFAQGHSFSFGVRTGLSIPNGQFRQLNLVKSSGIAGVWGGAEVPLTPKLNATINLSAGHVLYRRNHMRIPADCVSEPCLTYVSTSDSVRGRDLRFVNILPEVGVNYQLAGGFSIQFLWGCQAIIGAWERGAASEVNRQDHFQKYSPLSPVQFRRFNLTLAWGIQKRWVMRQGLDFLVHVDAQGLLSPIVRIPGYINWKKDFSLWPSQIRLGIGVCWYGA